MKAALSDKLTVSNDYRDGFAAAGLRSLDDLFAIRDGQRLEKASLPSWRERIRFAVPGLGMFYLKRYSSPPAAVQVRRILAGRGRWSTARSEWEQMQRLDAAGVESVRWAALGEEMAGRWERRSAVVTPAVPGESLEQYVARNQQPFRRDDLCRLARFVARFHGVGLVHRDLYLSHIFYDERDAEAPFRLIDVARVMRPRWRRRRWVVKDLAALDYSTPPHAATTADRLRFLKVYLGVDRLRPADRRLARQVVAKTRRIARHDARLRSGERPRP